MVVRPELTVSHRGSAHPIGSRPSPLHQNQLGEHSGEDDEDRYEASVYDLRLGEFFSFGTGVVNMAGVSDGGGRHGEGGGWD
jgi:hypothetical protein